MKKKINITIGADPELFIFDYKTNKVVSAIGIIPGEKGKAYRPDGFKKGFGLQIDNILAEFNIPPVKKEDDFVDYCLTMKNYIDEFVKKINPDYGVKCVASQHVDKELLNNPIAQQFGCSPDYNAYTMDANEPPLGAETDLRSTGFHIHIGYDNNDPRTSMELVKYLDITLGVSSVLIDPDVERRQLYGKAGCFRLTPYGVEYRVLSGYFLDNAKLLRLIFRLTQVAIDLCFIRHATLIDPELVINTINNGDKKSAQKILDHYRIKLESLK